MVLYVGFTIYIKNIEKIFSQDYNYNVFEENAGLILDFSGFCNIFTLTC